MGVCNCSMFCCTLLYVHSSIAIILKGKKDLVALLNLSSWCLVMVERLFLAVPWGCLRFVIVVFPDHTHLLFLLNLTYVAYKMRFSTKCYSGRINLQWFYIKHYSHDQYTKYPALYISCAKFLYFCTKHYFKFLTKMCVAI